MMSMNFNDIAIWNIKESDYRCVINRISKNEATNVMQNANMTEKCRNIKIYYNNIEIEKEIDFPTKRFLIF